MILVVRVEMYQVDSHLDIGSVLTRSGSPPGMLNVSVDSRPDIRSVLTRYAHSLFAAALLTLASPYYLGLSRLSPQ